MQLAVRVRSTEAHKSMARTPVRPAPSPARLGNQALLRRLTPTPRHLQASLEIGPTDDPLEREADRVADQVVMSAHADAAPATLRRKCAECEEQGSRLQTKRAGADPGIAIAPEIVHDVLHAPGERLDDATRAFMEPRFEQDFGDVRVHRDARAAASARSVKATAYTVGRNVVFDAGRYAPATEPGARLLAHELAHVVQQREMAPRVARQPAGAAGGDAEGVETQKAQAPDGSGSDGAQPMTTSLKECRDKCEQQFNDCKNHGGNEISCVPALQFLPARMRPTDARKTAAVAPTRRCQAFRPGREIGPLWIERPGQGLHQEPAHRRLLPQPL